MESIPSKPSLPDLVLRRVRAGIESGEWREQLPPERELSRKLRVSRPTLRLALDQLKQEGWLEVVGKRTVISSASKGQVREKAADQEWETLARVYRDAPVGLCYFDTDLRYRQVNEWLAAINGVSVEEHLGQTLGEVLPKAAAGIELQLRQVIETGEPILHGMVEMETPANPGEKKQFEHCYHPVRCKDGAIIGVSCVVLDVTEREHFRSVKLAAGNLRLIDRLTNRERVVLELVEKHLYDKEIGNRLAIYPETEKSHLKSIYKKLGVKNRRHAAAKLTSIGVLDDSF